VLGGQVYAAALRDALIGRYPFISFAPVQADRDLLPWLQAQLAADRRAQLLGALGVAI
jgi:hypothetical protein